VYSPTNLLLHSFACLRGEGLPGAGTCAASSLHYAGVSSLPSDVLITRSHTHHPLNTRRERGAKALEERLKGSHATGNDVEGGKGVVLAAEAAS